MVITVLRNTPNLAKVGNMKFLSCFGLNIFISEIDRHMYKVYKMLQIMGLERKQIYARDHFVNIFLCSKKIKLTRK